MAGMDSSDSLNVKPRESLCGLRNSHSDDAASTVKLSRFLNIVLKLGGKEILEHVYQSGKLSRK